jgi:tetratricopeptide (TPR) repeat protein
MKFKILLLILLVFVLFSCKDKADPECEIFYLSNCDGIDSITKFAEKKIIKASEFCLINSRNTDSLFNVLHQIEKAEIKSENNQFLNSYWQAFCCLHIAICQMEFKQDEKADSTIEKGLTILNNFDKKNSETYALLALLQGMSINYKSAMTLSLAAQKCKLYSEKAIDFNSKNIRGYLALAIYDFFTPEVYQGGKLVEKNLLKAIELDNSIDNNYSCLPTWGKDLVYRYLIRFYLKTDKKDLAKEFIEEALKEYPEDLIFIQMQKDNI